MYVDIVPNRGSRPAILLRRAWRQGGKIRKQTIANLSDWPLDRVEALRRLLRGETLVSPQEAFVTERTLPHGHVAAVLATARRLGIERLLGAKPSRERSLVMAMLVARIVDPCSKLALARGLEKGVETSSLAHILGVESADEDALYEALDWLLKRQSRMETALAKRHLADGGLVLYDVTSTYFEGRSCPLARHGHSRDGKPDRLQIVFGLLTDVEGRPVAVEVFEGNTGDPSTLAPQVAKMQQRFGLGRVVVVGDRGMLTDARIREDLSPHGLSWITALRAPAIRSLLVEGAFQLSLFDERDLGEITSEQYPGERLVVCRNPLLAEERARKRRALLQATEAELDKVVAATQRPKRPLRGKDRIALRVGKVWGRYKMAKHFRLSITDDAFSYDRDEQAIAEEAALDGIYIVRTDVPAEELDAEETVRTYKSLARVERAFRSFKSVDLKVRPIYHRLEDRVRAHIFLCMLAYYVEWHMRKRLAPLLFDDEDPAAGDAIRGSVVEPAQRSPEAQRKAHEKRTSDDLPVHSFQGLLTHLATLCKNRIRPKISSAGAFYDFASPTPLQQRAFELLEVPYRM
jgi:hypothetical protein